MDALRFLERCRDVLPHCLAARPADGAVEESISFLLERARAGDLASLEHGDGRIEQVHHAGLRWVRKHLDQRITRGNDSAHAVADAAGGPRRRAAA